MLLSCAASAQTTTMFQQMVLNMLLSSQMGLRTFSQEIGYKNCVFLLI